MNPRLAGLLVAFVPAAALPSAAPPLEWERQPREGFGASGAWEVVVGEQVGGGQAGGQGIPAATSARASSARVAPWWISRSRKAHRHAHRPVDTDTHRVPTE
jgi:hypothetical protein